MAKLNPAEARKRKKHILAFDNAWYVNTATSEIRYREPNKFTKISDYFWKKKYKVSDMYWWSAWKWYGSDMMPYPDAVKHDDIPIKDFPRKHQLVNGWSISEDDLKYLFDGPLIDENGKILVKHQSGLKKFISIVSQLKPLSWVIGFILFCIRYRAEIVAMFEYLSESYS